MSLGRRFETQYRCIAISQGSGKDNMIQGVPKVERGSWWDTKRRRGGTEVYRIGITTS